MYSQREMLRLIASRSLPKSFVVTIGPAVYITHETEKATEVICEFNQNSHDFLESLLIALKCNVTKESSNEPQ